MGQLDMATETGRGQISVVPMRGTRFMDTNLTHEREAPKRDNRNMDETNLPERDYVHMDETNQTVSKHKPTIYEGEDDQNSQDGEVEMMTHESQPGTQPGGVFTPASREGTTRVSRMQAKGGTESIVYTDEAGR